MATEVTLTEPPNGLFSRIAAGIAKLVELIKYIAGAPDVAERATFLSDSTALTAAGDPLAPVPGVSDDRSQVFTSMDIQFTQASGSLRYDFTGRGPTAAGRGFQFPSGGGMLSVSGAENIRNFRLICETGQLANFTVILYKSGIWNRER